MKKQLLYLSYDAQTIGTRDHHFDWKVGDKIMTDGVETTIMAIYDKTPENLNNVHLIFKYVWRKRVSFGRKARAIVEAVNEFVK